MKNVVFAFLQCVLFVIVLTGGSFFPVFHLQSVVSVTSDGTRVFIWDGLLLTTLLFLLILLIEALRKRIRTAGLWTTAAFVLSVVASLVVKIGFKTS
jgi:ABC-type microcin C transport system permease subunit YejB